MAVANLRSTDLATPLEPPRVLAALESAGLEAPFLLESALPFPGLGRTSFLGFGPRWRLERRAAGDPLGELAARLAAHGIPRAAREATGLPFAGGAVGFLGYDLGRTIERLPSRAAADQAFPALSFAYYAHVLAHDAETGRWTFAGDGEGFDAACEAARRAIEGFEDERGDGDGDEDGDEPEPEYPFLRSNFPRDGYLRAVERAIEYIRAGDIYQVCLSQRFEARAAGAGPLALYERLRRVSPAPFMACLRDAAGRAVLSASPERFLAVRGRRVETRPIKGTRPRGRTPPEDAALGRELVESRKDAAELAMIVDLERNDLGRAALPGSVRVSRPRALESFPAVHHLVATVEADLRPGVGPCDLLRAAFPGGSVTGCPKVRAMEIIDELEPTRRSVYCGAIGYLGRDADLDLAIAIRTALVDGDRATFQAGGAVTADSDPAAEFEETLVKARALARALRGRVGPCPASRT